MYVPNEVQRVFNDIAEHVRIDSQVEDHNAEIQALRIKIAEHEAAKTRLSARRAEIAHRYGHRLAMIGPVLYRTNRTDMVISHVPGTDFLTISEARSMSALGVKDEAPKPRMFADDQLREMAFDQAFGDVFGDEAKTIKLPAANVASSLAVIDQEAS
jgi:hypothetical protein